MNIVEKISEIALQVITYAGLAKSKYIESLTKYRENDFDGVELLISEGDRNYNVAHRAHLCLLQDEMSLKEPQITMLLAHAEDQLMAADTIKTLIVEIMKLMEMRK